MDSGRKEVQEVIQKLISAQHKIMEWEMEYDRFFKAFGALQDVILGKDSVTETYDDLLAPVKDLVKFRSNTLYCLQIPQDTETDKAINKLSRVLKPRSTEERDSTLSQIREALGAKDRNEDRPHETALQAAKRVMEELQDLKKKHANTVKSSTGRTYTPPEGYIVVKEDLLKQTITETIQDTVRACKDQFWRELI